MFHPNKDRDGTKERVNFDYYPTPSSCTIALMDHLVAMNILRRGQTIQEPASGSGHISKVLEFSGYPVISSDIRPTEEIYGQGDINFMSFRKRLCDVMITNPPYKFSEAFIRKAHELKFPVVALLLRSNFYQSQMKAQLFHEIPPSEVAVIPWPVQPDKERGKASFLDFAWFLWYPSVYPCRYTVLQKPKE